MPEVVEEQVVTGVRRVRHVPTTAELADENTLTTAVQYLRNNLTVNMIGAPAWAVTLYNRQQAIMRVLKGVVSRLGD